MFFRRFKLSWQVSHVTVSSYDDDAGKTLLLSYLASGWEPFAAQAVDSGPGTTIVWFLRRLVPS